MIALAIKYMTRQKQKSIVVIIALAIVTISMVITVNTFYGERRSEMNAKRIIEGKYHFSTDFSEYGPLMQAVDKLAFPDKSFYGLESVLGSCILGQGIQTVMYGLDEEGFSLECPKVLKGRLPAGENEICVEEQLLSALGSPGLNEEIELNITLENGDIITKQFRLTGVISYVPNRARYFGEAGILYTTESTARSIDKTARRKLTGLLSKSEYFNYFYYYQAENYYKDLFVPFDKRESLFEDILGDTGIQIKTVSFYNSIYSDNSSDMRNYMQYIIPCVAFIAVIIIYGIFHVNLESRKKQYHLLRCIGITRGKLLLMLCMEALVLSIIGWGIGLAAGLFLYEYVIKIAIASYSGAEVLSGFYEPIVHQSLFLTVAVSLASLIFPAFKVSGYHPYETKTQKKIRLVWLKRLLSKDTEKEALYLARRYLLSKNNLIVTYSLMISMFFSVFAAFLYWRLDDMQKMPEYDVFNDFSISLGNKGKGEITESFGAEEIKKIQETEGVEKVVAYYSYNTDAKLVFDEIFTDDKKDERYYLPNYAQMKREYQDTYLSTLEVIVCDKGLLDILFTEDFLGDTEWSQFMEGNAGIVSFSISGANMEPPSYVPLTSGFSYEVDGEERWMRVLKSIEREDNFGFLHQLGEGVGVFHIYTSFEGFFKERDVRYNKVTIFTKENVDLYQVKQKLYEICLPYRSAKLSDMNETNRALFDYMENQLFAIVMFAVVIAIIMQVNLFNTCMASMETRIKSFGILRILGMDYIKVKKIIFYEGVYVGAFGTVSGFLLGLFFTIAIAWDIVRETSLFYVLKDSPVWLYGLLIAVNFFFSMGMMQLALRLNKDKLS